MKRRILIVDDEEGIRLVFLKALEHAGYEVSTADSASEALRIAHEETFDLALVDLSLPDASDLDLLSLIRASVPELPVIVLTGMVFSNEQAAQMTEAGARDVLSKVSSLDLVLKKIERFFQYG